MKTIECSVMVDENRTAVVHFPPGVAPGKHNILVVWEDDAGHPVSLKDLPVFDVGPWPEGLSLRREDMYGDDMR